MLALLVAGACGLPRDPEGTLDRIRGGILRVGLVEHHSWAVMEGDRPAGVEVELVEGFARAHGGAVRWIPGPQERLFPALEEGQLDLVIGGLTSDNPWSQRVTLARPYLRSELVVGAPMGSGVPQDLDGVEVAVEEGTHAAALVEAEGGIPLRVGDLEQADGLAAVPGWRLRSLGLRRTGIVLETTDHVMAIVAGENAFQSALERYLIARQAELPRLLEATS